MSNPEDPNKKPPPQPTVAWNPEDVPGFGSDEPAEPAPQAETPTPAEEPTPQHPAPSGEEPAAPPPQAPQPPAPPPAEPQQPAQKPPPQPTMAWDPADMLAAASTEEEEAPAAAPPAAAPPAEPPPAQTATPPPPAAPPKPAPQATLAWNPEDVAQAVEAEAAEAAAAEDEDDPLIGTILRDKWKVLKRLGAGSFGTVYKVEDLKGGWIDALKILGVDRLVGAEAENMKKRFLREAQIMKRLGKESKHIVGLSTYEEDFEAGLIYFLMEYVEGKPLADVVADDGPFTVERTIHVALHVCDALIAAHEGAELVVHRDLKLENLMMTIDHAGEEIVKVLDFGIAKIAEKETEVRLTTVGTLGTPGYAAPEQLRAEDVDGRTDLFAFGVILYSLLTGRDPWLGGLAHVATDQIYELMVATDRGEVKPMEDAGVDVPPAMKNVVMKLLRREPSDRYQTASELRDALLRVRAGGGDVDAGSLRVLSDQPGVQVQIRSGRKVVAEGPTPCVANGISEGTYSIALKDPRFEPVETTVTLAAGAMEDITLIATPRETGVGSTARRNKGAIAAVIALVLVGGGAAFLQPWGRTLSLADVQARASEGAVSGVRVSEAGINGRLAVLGPLPPMPFRVPVGTDDVLSAVEQLRSAGIDVDTSFEVARLVGMAASAQARTRYFGFEGDDVRSYAERVAELEPESQEATSLLLKVAERMAWDAAAASTDGSPDRAQELVNECLEVVPDHPRCAAAGGER